MKRPKHECRCLYNGPDAKRDSETKSDFVNRKTEDAYKMAGIIVERMEEKLKKL